MNPSHWRYLQFLIIDDLKLDIDRELMDFNSTPNSDELATTFNDAIAPSEGKQGTLHSSLKWWHIFQSESIVNILRIWSVQLRGHFFGYGRGKDFWKQLFCWKGPWTRGYSTTPIPGCHEWLARPCPQRRSFSSGVLAHLVESTVG